MEKIIRVTGKGEVAVKPDTIWLSLRLSDIDKDYSKSLEKVDKKVFVIKAEMKKLGVEEVKTEHFSVRQQTKRIYKKNNDYEDVFEGYVTEHNLKISFDYDTKLLGRVVSSLAGSLVEPRFDIHFTASKLDGVKAQLLKSAVENAKEDAQALAQAAGVKLDGILTINHSFSEVHYTYPRTSEFYGAERLCMAKEECSSLSEIEVDDIKLNANVTIEWKID